MLPNIENLEMKTESSDLPQQWIDKGLSEKLPAIRHQAQSQHPEIGFKLRRVLIGILNAGAFPAAMQPVNHVRKKAAVKFHGIGWPPEHGSCGHRPLILRQPRQNLSGCAHLLQ